MRKLLVLCLAFVAMSCSTDSDPIIEETIDSNKVPTTLQVCAVELDDDYRCIEYIVVNGHKYIDNENNILWLEVPIKPNDRVYIKAIGKFSMYLSNGNFQNDDMVVKVGEFEFQTTYTIPKQI